MRKKVLLVTVLMVSLVFILGVSGVAKPLYYKIYPVVNIVVNGTEVIPAEGDVPAFQIDGRTMVPIRMVAEALKAEVEWDEQTRTVVITKEESVPVPVDTQPAVSADLIKIKDITFNTSRTRIIGVITNENAADVDVRATINCYGRNEVYLGHVHVVADELETKEFRAFQVDANEDLKETGTFKATIDSIKVH